MIKFDFRVKESEFFEVFFDADIYFQKGLINSVWPEQTSAVLVKNWIVFFDCSLKIF